MRLIDADALMPLFIEKAYTMKDRHGVKLGEEWLLNYNDIQDVIDNAPIVEERPQGEWIMNKTSARGRNYTCTNCQKVSRNKSEFYPKCGADMRGDT